MYRTTVLLAVLALTTATAKGQESPASRSQPGGSPLPPAMKVDTARLRALAYLPEGTVAFRFGEITPPCLDERPPDPRQPAEKIAALEKDLKGDASDAERYLELSELYEDDERAEHALSKARELFKQKIQVEATNGWLHCLYAVTLWTTPALAEPIARKAVELAPGDYRCWESLSVVFVRAHSGTAGSLTCLV
jgi:hypothetical protein